MPTLFNTLILGIAIRDREETKVDNEGCTDKQSCSEPYTKPKILRVGPVGEITGGPSTDWKDTYQPTGFQETKPPGLCPDQEPALQLNE